MLTQELGAAGPHFPAAAFEFPHEIHELVDSRFRERIIKGRANSAHGTVPFEAVHALCGRLPDEGLFEVLAWKPERDVHQRSMLLPRRSTIEARTIERGVRLRRLAFVDPGNRLQPSRARQPFHDEA